MQSFSMVKKSCKACNTKFTVGEIPSDNIRRSNSEFVREVGQILTSEYYT